MPSIELHTTLHQTASGLPYQHLHIGITTPDGLIEPADLKSLQLPEPMIWSMGVVIEGRAPIWLYGCLVHLCHPAVWVACFDPRLGEPVPRSGGALVVLSHSPTVTVGQVLTVTLPESLVEQNQSC